MTALLAFLTPEHVLFAIGALTAGGVWAYRTLSHQSVDLKARRLAQIQAFAHLAYVSVNEVSRLTKTDVDDKIAVALKKIEESLAAAQAKSLTPAEIAHVGQVFDALHYQDELGGVAPLATASLSISP